MTTTFSSSSSSSSPQPRRRQAGSFTASNDSNPNLIPSVSKVGSYSLTSSSSSRTQNSISNRQTFPFSSDSFNEIQIPSVSPPADPESSRSAPVGRVSTSAQRNTSPKPGVSTQIAHYGDPQVVEPKIGNLEGKVDQETLQENDNRTASRSTRFSLSPRLDEDEYAQFGKSGMVLEPAWDDASLIDFRGGSSIDYGSPSLNDIAQDRRGSQFSNLSMGSEDESKHYLGKSTDQSELGRRDSDFKQEGGKIDLKVEKVLSKSSSIGRIPYFKNSIFDSSNSWNPNLRGSPEEISKATGQCLPLAPVSPQIQNRRDVQDESAETPTASTFEQASNLSLSKKEEAYEVEALRRQVEQLQMALVQRSKMGQQEEIPVTQNPDGSTPKEEEFSGLSSLNFNHQDRAKEPDTSKSSLRNFQDQESSRDGIKASSGSASTSRDNTFTRIIIPERAHSLPGIDPISPHSSQREMILQKEREIMLLKQLQHQQLPRISDGRASHQQSFGPANRNDSLTSPVDQNFQVQTLTPLLLSRDHSSPQLPFSTLPQINEHQSQSQNFDPSDTQISRTQSSGYFLGQQSQGQEDFAQTRHRPQWVDDRLYSPTSIRQPIHSLQHQHSPRRLQQQQQQQHQLYDSLDHPQGTQSHGSFSPSESFVDSSYKRGNGSGMSSAATSVWQDDDGNRSMSFPPSASVTSSRNEIQLEEMQRKIEALERLVMMQSGLPSTSNSLSDSEVTPFPISISSPLSVRDQLPGPSPSVPLPSPPQIKPAQNQFHQSNVSERRVSRTGQAGLPPVHPSSGGMSMNLGINQAQVQAQAQSRSSGSTSSGDSMQWLNQKQLDQKQSMLLHHDHQTHQTTKQGGYVSQSSFIDRNQVDEHNLRRPSQSTLSSLQTTFNFNATSPVNIASGGNNRNLSTGSSSFSDMGSSSMQPQSHSSSLQSQSSSPESPFKSKSSRFLPSFGRRKSASFEDSSKELASGSDSPSSPSDVLHKADSYDLDAGKKEKDTGKKEVWNGFSRKHSKVLVDEQPAAKFKQGPGRGRVYITPPEKRKKKKD